MLQCLCKLQRPWTFSSQTGQIILQIRQPRLAKPKPQHAYFPRVWPDQTPEDRLGAGLISSMSPPQPQTRPRVLLHALLTCCQVHRRRSAALSSTLALCGTPRAPWRNSTILFQSGLKGTTKLPSSAAGMETQHQLGSVRDQGSEYRKAVDYGAHRYAIFSDASISIRCQSERRRLCDTSRGERAEV